MTRRRKKMLILIAIVLLLIGGFIFLIIPPSTWNETTTTEPDGDNIDEVIEQVESMDEESQTAAGDLSQNLRDAIDQTLNVFTQNDYHITALGDSLTQGVGDETNNAGYVGVLERRLTNKDYRVNIDNFGRRGNRTDQLITRLEEENAIQRSISRSDVVLITIGANDIMRIVRENIMDLNEAAFSSELNDYENRLHEIFELINEYNEETEVFLIGFFNPFAGYFEDVEALYDILDEWNQTGAEVVQMYPNAHFISIEDLFSIDDVNLLADDNFHPNETGYSLMGSRVLSTILPLLDEMHETAEDVEETEDPFDDSDGSISLE
ncbi:SGNH/GDSL hydrolase family protein [Pelagirhabdus alkalitolerans]|nr:SGNH/GDSL hydrolase family protein [Pelagirhabdus alkalitolerans]